MKILYTTARLPYPPLRGDQLVPFSRMRLLARKHEITLLSFVESRQELEWIEELRKHCEQIHVVPLTRWQAYANIPKNIFTSLPLQVAYYDSQLYRRRLTEILARDNFDVIHTILARPANHVVRLSGPVKVCEMIDTLSLTMKRKADAAAGPARWFWRMEERRMRKFEDEICRQFDGVVVVSEVDRQQLRSENVRVVPVGADLAMQPKPSPNGHRIVIFSGNLAYGPNEDAALFLIQGIWPRLRKMLPKAQLKIVGSGPSERVRQAAHPFADVEVTGFVPDLRKYLLEADVAIAPIRSGGAGMHCKALEAMACGTPVVVSSHMTGVPGKPEENFLVANDEYEYVQAVRRLVEDRELATKLGERGKQLISEQYSWERTTEQLETFYEELLSRSVRRVQDAFRN
ncbi:MAG TPA: glycosyltransferase family 4 protein [Dongiaceae bacterium]|nr:glycosyltransferase family 4 protein [Dongiaceae bacterium]